MQTIAAITKSGNGNPEVLVLTVCPSGTKNNLNHGYTGVVAEVVKYVFESLLLMMTEQGQGRQLVDFCLGRRHRVVSGRVMF
jgi:hypothetical protein